MGRESDSILKELVHLLFEGLDVHIYWKDTSFRYIYCNPLQAKSAGFNHPKEMIGKTDYDIFPKSVANALRRNDQVVLNTGKSRVFEEEGRRDHRKFVFLTQKIPIIRNGKIIGIAGISFDITTRIESEEKMRLAQRNAETTLYEILNNLPGHVYWKDKNGVFLGCNQAQVISAGYKTKSDIIGKTDHEFPWKANVKQIMESDQYVISTKKTITREEEAQIRGAKESSIFLSKKAPLFNASGEVIGVLGISFDITDRKEMEKELILAKEKSEVANYAMTELISNLGHDLATPISDVGSVAQLLHFYSDDYPELKELFDTLDERAKACESVRKTIINATSPANLEIKPESFPIAEELLAIDKALRPTIGSKNLQLILRPLKPKKEDLIETDKNKFHEIMMDLVSNAINFTEEGQVVITVFKENDRFIITVADTGIGIPSDQYDYIFQQYTKLTRSNKYGATFKGVGAGLYLARIRANLLDATITVESELGKGSTFTLSIPTHPLKRTSK